LIMGREVKDLEASDEKGALDAIESMNSSADTLYQRNYG
jgi:hypothetical protein